MEKKLPKRKRLRLMGFDYNTPGAYFITICTSNRRNMLSHIVGSIHESTEAELTEYGKIVDKVIKTIPEHCGAAVTQYVIMPNHVHLILVINAENDQRAIRESPLQGRSAISKTIGYLKMKASKEIHECFGNTAVWQRGFHDHIIRNRESYWKIAAYIRDNPKRWQYDCFYSEK